MRFLIVACLSLAACVSPDPLDGVFLCGNASDLCPPSQSCVCGKCYANPQNAPQCNGPDSPLGGDSPRASDGPIVSTTDGPPKVFDAPISTIDAPPGAPDARGAPDAAPGSPDAKLTTPDAKIGTPDAPISTPDAPISTPDAPISTPDAPPAPDAQLFDARRGPPPDAPAPFCGDGTCQNAAGETCVSCEEDCGVCLCNAGTVCLLAPGGSNCQNCPQCFACACNDICTTTILGGMKNDCQTCPSDCTHGECP